MIVCLAATGCERSAQTPAGAVSNAAPKQSPEAVIEQLMALRRSGAYQSMSPLVVPERTHEVVNTLMAVDEFLHANRALCNFVRDRITLGLAQSIDQAHWGDHLDVFSRYVELVNEHVNGDTATVSFMVDGQLPVRRATLRRINGQWRYDPGSGYDPQLPAAFKRMARGLRQVLDDLKSGRLPIEAVRDDPERLIEEIRLRLLPGVKMLPPPATQPDGD
jgi:hypothetical protein